MVTNKIIEMLYYPNYTLLLMGFSTMCSSARLGEICGRSCCLNRVTMLKMTSLSTLGLFQLQKQSFSNEKSIFCSDLRKQTGEDNDVKNFKAKTHEATSLYTLKKLLSSKCHDLTYISNKKVLSSSKLLIFPSLEGLEMVRKIFFDIKNAF